MELGGDGRISPEICPISLSLFGNGRRVYFVEPELMRDVLLKSNIIQKTPSHPLVKLLVSGLVAQEGEQWAKRRKIINLVFKR